jgi:hypothetical protein
MNFGKLKTALAAIINRKDLTDELAGDFINRAIKDVERVVRIGGMERVLETPAYDGISNTLMIPNDYLELIDLFMADRQLIQKDKAAILRDTSTAGPQIFAKIADRWLISPAPGAGDIMFLHYYAEHPDLLTDTDENVWTKSCFNAVLYAAANLASDFYQMEDQVVARFGSKAGDYITAIQQQNLDELWSGPMNIELPLEAGDF